MMKKPQLSYVTVLMVLFSIGNAYGETLHFSSGEKRVTLIELFTSEGCSSCPPAEAWLGGFKSDQRLWHEIIPVAFHVDYWDSLGWKDTFSSPLHSQRQRRYQREGGVRSVYTPGIVVNGLEWRGWFRLQDPPFKRHPAAQLELALGGSTVTAQYAGITQHNEAYILNLAVLAFDHRSQVTSGENSGRYLHQDFAVVGYKTAASNSGSWHTTLPSLIHTEAKRYGVAAWVSRAGSQAPLQAAGGWIPSSIIEDNLP